MQVCQIDVAAAGAQVAVSDFEATALSSAGSERQDISEMCKDCMGKGDMRVDWAPCLGFQEEFVDVAACRLHQKQ